MVKNSEKDNKKPGLGSKILNFVPWRVALTAAAIPVAGPIAGAVVGTLAYGNYRKNNIEQESGDKKEQSNKKGKSDDEKEQSAEKEPSNLKKLLFRGGAILAGFIIGGPVGAIVATSLVVADIAANGALINGIEKSLDVGYNVLSNVANKSLDAGKWVAGKIKGSKEIVSDQIDNTEDKIKGSKEQGQSGEHEVSAKEVNEDKEQPLRRSHSMSALDNSVTIDDLAKRFKQSKENLKDYKDNKNEGPHAKKESARREQQAGKGSGRGM
ncbi:hypothetical protein [Wolbachia endosymbiont of Pentidionis agamae]|uniref:hypothetical protein n=1 Tax=Wolbachia endosymbiont of Pentidionis agamae TaxID=3110435 RepID=UPI002FD26E80